MEPYPCSRSCKSKNDISRKSSFFNSEKLALLLSKVELDQHLYGAVRTTASNDVIHFSITMTNYKLWGNILIGIKSLKRMEVTRIASHKVISFGNNCRCSWGTIATTNKISPHPAKNTMLRLVQLKCEA